MNESSDDSDDRIELEFGVEPADPDSDLNISLRDRKKPFYCLKCDYRLTGIDSFTCPECGNPLRFDDLDSVTLEKPGVIRRRTLRRIARIMDYVMVLWMLGVGVVIFIFFVWLIIDAVQNAQ